MSNYDDSFDDSKKILQPKLPSVVPDVSFS